MDNRAQVREFLASRRARITPGQAGLPAYGGNRRVKGLRPEEAALLAGVSIDYYIRMDAATSRAPPRRSSTALRTHCNSTRPSASTCRR